MPGGSSNTGGIEVHPGEVFESIDCPKTLVGRVIGKGTNVVELFFWFPLLSLQRDPFSLLVGWSFLAPCLGLFLF